MQRRYSLVHLILGGVVALSLTPLMVCVEAQARIAFASNRDGNYEIYVMDADGANLQRLTNNPHGDSSPSWSPDGKQIAFTSKRDGHVINGIPTDEIYVMDTDGGNPQNLTNNPHADYYPSWSPDGKQIAFASDRDGNFEIYVIDADGGNPQNLTNNPHADYYPHGHPTVNALSLLLVGMGTLKTTWTSLMKSTLWTPMGGINKDSLKIARMTGFPHGHPTVNRLPSCLIGRGTL